jgi:hypothetical protein
MKGFGLADIKREGYVNFEIDGIPQSLPKDIYELRYGKIQEYDWTYIERSIPRKYVDQIHLLIDHFLAEHEVKDEDL